MIFTLKQGLEQVLRSRCEGAEQLLTQLVAFNIVTNNSANAVICSSSRRQTPCIEYRLYIQGVWWYSSPIFSVHSSMQYRSIQNPRGQILGRNPDKGRKIFPPCYFQSHLQLCLVISILKTHATSNSFYRSVTVHCKGERRKPYRKPYRNLKYENLSRLCQETSTKFYVGS